MAQARARRQSRSRQCRGQTMTAFTVSGLCKSFGGLHVTTDVNLNVEPGERRLIIGPNGAGKTTLFNLITGELTPDSGMIKLFDQDITHVPSRRRAHLGMARTYQIITLFARHDYSQCVAGAAGPFPFAVESADRSQAAGSFCRTCEGSAGTGWPWPHSESAVGTNLLWRAPAGRGWKGGGGKYAKS